MKKLFFLIFIIITLTNCGKETYVNYRIHHIDKIYKYNKITVAKSYFSPYSPSVVTISNNDIVIRIRFYSDEIGISSLKLQKNNTVNYKKFLIIKPLNDIIIKSKNQNKIIIKKENITIYKSKQLLFKPPFTVEPPTENFMLDVGRLEINEKIYKMPKIYIKKFELSMYVSLTSQLLGFSGIYGGKNTWIYDKGEDPKVEEKKLKESYK